MGGWVPFQSAQTAQSDRAERSNAAIFGPSGRVLRVVGGFSVGWALVAEHLPGREPAARELGTGPESAGAARDR